MYNGAIHQACGGPVRWPGNGGDTRPPTSSIPSPSSAAPTPPAPPAAVPASPPLPTASPSSTPHRAAKPQRSASSPAGLRRRQIRLYPPLPPQRPPHHPRRAAHLATRPGRPPRRLDRTGASQILVNVTLRASGARPQPASAPAPVAELLQQVTDARRPWPQSNRNAPGSRPPSPRSAPAPSIIPGT